MAGQLKVALLLLCAGAALAQEDYNKYLRNFVCPALGWIGDEATEQRLMATDLDAATATVAELRTLFDDSADQSNALSIWERGCFRLVKLLNADIDAGGVHVAAINKKKESVTEAEYTGEIAADIQTMYQTAFNDIAPTNQLIAAPFEGLCVSLMGGELGYVTPDDDFSEGPKC